jgi:Protein of unknown function (DUF1706)
MGSQVTRTDLLAALIAGRANWDALLDEVGERRMEESGVIGSWSVKQVIAHITGWDRWAAELARAFARGEPLTPHENEEHDFHARNASAVAEFGNGSPGEVRAASDEVFGNLLGSVELLNNDQLAQKGLAFWSELDDVGDIVAECSYKHYQEHGKQIRAWLERDGM